MNRRLFSRISFKHIKPESRPINPKKSIYLNKTQYRLFSTKSSLPVDKSFFQKFVSIVKRFINKRIIAFRILFYASFILIGFTFLRYSNNVNFAKNITPIFFMQNEVNTNAYFNVAGVVKPGTISMIKGTDELSFVLTDYEHELTVFYKGQAPGNFLEGNTVVATGSITDSLKPDILVCNKIMTEHGYNGDQWLSKLNNFRPETYEKREE